MSDQYISPLLSRIKEQEPLTLKNLAHYVPIVQAGTEAENSLQENPQHPNRRELYRQTREAEEAKEKLILIALPLIKSLAYKELTRRQAWNTRVSFEDIVSEGISGFLKGIYKYNPQGKHRSPTNYIGQWVTTEMRREVEKLDHDFAVPYEAIERQRKIRAVRSRLSSELGRDPTDEEILEACNQKSPYSDNMMGRVDKSQQSSTGSRKRIITQKHLDEERNMLRRTGAVLASDHMVGGDDDSSVSTLEALSATSITHEDSPKAQEVQEEQLSSVEAVNAQVVKKNLSELIENSFNHLGVQETQREIIRRRFGLHPYGEEQKVRDISLHTKVPTHRISRIVRLFSTEMSTPGGSFHFLMSKMNEDEVESLGLGWIMSSLGKYDTPNKKPTHKDLTRPLFKDSVTTPPPSMRGSTSSDGVLATFYCPKEHRKFTHNYESESKAPATTGCPFCDAIAARV